MDQLVMEALFNGYREEKIRAAINLSKLTSKERHQFVEKGVIAPLVSMLNSQDYDAIEAALTALLSLAFGSERNKISIAKSGAIPSLIEILQSQNESLIELVLATLLILSSCSKNKLAIASSGAIQLLLQIINYEDRYISTQAKLDAIAILRSLSITHQITPLIVSAGAASHLLRLIYGGDKSSDLVEKATELLQAIVSSSEIGLFEVVEEGGIRVLVEAVEEGSQLCREHAVGVLLLMCERCGEKYRGMILREGPMPGLLQLSMTGTRRAKNMARALLLLLRDYSKPGQRKERTKINVVLEKLMEEIDAEEEKIVNGNALRPIEELIAKLNR